MVAITIYDFFSAKPVQSRNRFCDGKFKENAN